MPHILQAISLSGIITSVVIISLGYLLGKWLHRRGKKKRKAKIVPLDRDELAMANKYDYPKEDWEHSYH